MHCSPVSEVHSQPIFIITNTVLIIRKRLFLVMDHSGDWQMVGPYFGIHKISHVGVLVHLYITYNLTSHQCIAVEGPGQGTGHPETGS